ncbi:AraC family transcriptional regulator [Sphingobacterium micropteri]|nr:AraC family transcriptional regulator [Sphingobacterium micropteri]
MDKKIKEGFIGQRMIVLPIHVQRDAEKNDIIDQFYLTAIGYYPHAAYHNRSRKRGCNQYIMLYCTNGTGTVTIHDKTYTISPNHYIILPRDTPHHYHSSSEDPWTIYWVHFTGKHAAALYERYAENNVLPVFYPFDQRKADEFESIYNLLEHSFRKREFEIANLKLQHYIASFIYATEINPSIVERDKIDESIIHMKNNLHEPLAVRTLAEQQQLSVTHYTRLFKIKTGTSPNQYLNELKIQKSCQYLYFSELSIKEICVELGFTDPYYFSRLFKKTMGMSPAKYKKKYQMTS